MEQESTETYAVRKGSYVPKYGAIVDVTKLYTYVQGVTPLNIVCKVMGFPAFLELLVSSCISEDNDPRDELDAIFFNKELEEFDKYDIEIEELHYDLVEFQRYRERFMLEHVDRDIQENMDEYGFEIKKWLSPTTVIIESFEYVSLNPQNARVRFRNRTYETVGADRGLIQDHQRLRERTGITHSDIPY